MEEAGRSNVRKVFFGPFHVHLRWLRQSKGVVYVVLHIIVTTIHDCQNTFKTYYLIVPESILCQLRCPWSALILHKGEYQRQKPAAMCTQTQYSVCTRHQNLDRFCIDVMNKWSLRRHKVQPFGGKTGQIPWLSSLSTIRGLHSSHTASWDRLTVGITQLPIETSISIK